MPCHCHCHAKNLQLATWDLPSKRPNRLSKSSSKEFRMLSWRSSSSSSRRRNEQLFRLRAASISLRKHSKKFKAKEKATLRKVTRAVAAGDERAARTYAAHAVHFGDMADRTLQLACKVEMVSSVSQISMATGEMSNEIRETVDVISGHLKPLETMQSMDAFNEAYDDINLASGMITNTLTTAVVSHDEGASSREDEVLNWAKEMAAQDTRAMFPTVPAANCSTTGNGREDLQRAGSTSTSTSTSTSAASSSCHTHANMDEITAATTTTASLEARLAKLNTRGSN